MEYIDREVGQFPLSIGTSLALEGLFGIHPSQERHPPGAKRITEVWINLRTVIRNYFAAMSSEDAQRVTMDEAVSTLLSELQVIATVCEQHHSGKYRPVLYNTDLSEVKWLFPEANHREPKTERQRHYHTLETLAFKLVMDNVNEQALPIVTIRKQPTTTPTSIALMTHYPHELLWRFQFDTLMLLESHTGKLKPHSQWVSKLNGLSAEDHIPFSALTLQLFGDGVMLDAFPRKIKDEVKQLAQVRRWTSITTLEKVKDDIRRHGSTDLNELVVRLSKR